MLSRSTATASPVLATLDRILIVAELTTNHFGDIDRLERMVNLAADAGADLIKVQKRRVDTFYPADKLAAAYESPFGQTFGAYRHALELDSEGFDRLDAVCRERGLKWFASALDVPSFAFFADRGHSLIKLPSTVTHHEDLVEIAANSAIDMVLSTGMMSHSAVERLVDRFSLASRLYLLQCTSAYPAPPADCNVAVVRGYWELSQADTRIVPGYSSHDPGNFASCLAVAAGAKMIEKHVKLGSTPWAHFDQVALDLGSGEFRAFVADVRRATAVTGTEEKVILPSEDHKYPQLRS